MKRSQVIAATIAIWGVLPCILSSCNLLNKTFTSGNNSTTTGELQQVPQDRRPVSPAKRTPTYTPEELKRGEVKGDWAIELVNGRKPVSDVSPYIKFEPTQGRIYGSNGCNIFNGTYKCNPKDSTLQFDNMITTLRACDTPGITDVEIDDALSRTVRYAWSHDDDSRYYLYLKDVNGAVVLRLMHQNFQFLNGIWLVRTIKNEAINTEGNELVPDMKLVIDVDEGKVHGNTGCNILNGTFEIDMERPNSISFQNLATTFRLCPEENNFETDLLVALEEATTAQAVNAERVQLLDSSGTVIMVLTRTTDE